METSGRPWMTCGAIAWQHTLIRGEEIPAGGHTPPGGGTFLVRHTDGSFLLTQRDPQKPAFPGCWELSAGGSVLAGETALSGAMRELREETGIQADALAPAFRSHLARQARHLSRLCVPLCGR